jgi:hypothetical protein
MLKLELDWAAPDAPELDVVSNDGDDVLVVVAYDATPGPAGWGTVTVYAHALDGVPAYREAQELDAWLEVVYGAHDEEERQDLLDTAS